MNMPFWNILKRNQKLSVISSKPKLNQTDCRQLLSKKLNFKLRSKLGTGHHGTVFSVITSTSKKPLACKILCFGSFWSETCSETVWNQKDGFTQESEILARINHPNVVQYEHCFQVYSQNGQLLCLDSNQVIQRNSRIALLMTGLLMEKLDLNLVDWMSKKRMSHLPEGQLINLFLQIGSALEYLHTRLRVCHHDVKGTNIALLNSVSSKQLPTFKLIDFGQARKESEERFFEIESQSFGSHLLRWGNVEKVKNWKCTQFRDILMTLAGKNCCGLQVNIHWALEQFQSIPHKNQTKEGVK